MRKSGATGAFEFGTWRCPRAVHARRPLARDGTSMILRRDNSRQGYIPQTTWIATLLVFMVVAVVLAGGKSAREGQDSDLIYVDYRIKVARSRTYDPTNRTCGRGTAIVHRTLKGAANAAVAGKTVLIRAGTYSEQLRPANSGKPGKYITFKNYKGEKVTITGQALRPAINISKRSYIVIKGLDITNVRRWLHAVQSHHNVITGNRFSKAMDPGGSSKTGLFFQQATYNRITGNTIEDSTQDNLSLIRSDRNIVENNVFRRARHVLWVIKGGSFNVLRDNFFHNEWQKIGEVYDCHDVGFNREFFVYNCTKRNLIERNRFAYTPSSGNRSPYAGIQYAGQDGIIRNNLFYDTVGPALSMTLYGKEANFNTGNRVYNNVFHKTDFAGINLSGSKNFSFSGNVIKNNILSGSRFVANDRRWKWWTRELAGKPVQVLCGRLDGFVFQNNNVFSPGRHTNYLIALGFRSPLVKVQRSLTKLQAAHPRFFVDNTQYDPAFVDAKKHDFRLQRTSRLIDRGAFLTRTTRKGSGDLMPVADAAWFYDGYDIPGEKGDLIQLEGQRYTARVIDIDYEKNVLSLSQSLTWRKGQGVGLRYQGRRPDIGAHEFIPGGNRPPVAAFTGIPRSNAPLTVDFDASASDDADGKLVRYDWDFGDGKAAANGSVRLSHTYAKQGSYTVSLKVTDDGKLAFTGVAMQTVSVGRPVLRVETKALDFGRVRTASPFTLSNSGQGTLVFRVRTSAAWLSADRTYGTCTIGKKAIILRVIRHGMRAGRYTATVTIDAGAGGRHRIAVTVKVPVTSQTKLVKVGDKWRYWKVTDKPPRRWKDLKFNDARWLEGPSGIGFSRDVAYATTLNDMRGNYIAVFMRRRFQIKDASLVVQLRLGIKYDDGFAAYINGREVARSDSMGTLGTRFRPRQELLSEHDEKDPEEIYTIKLGGGLLLSGDNILAIEFRNAWIKNADACAVPRLEASVMSD